MNSKSICPSQVTRNRVLNAYIKLATLANVKLINGYVLSKGLQSDVILGNRLLNMYGKCGDPEAAHKVFNMLYQKDLIAWSAIISIYAQDGHGKQALQLIQQMKFEGIEPNSITFSSILDACRTSKVLAEGKFVHACALPGPHASDVVLGNALVNMYSKCGSLEDAERTFVSMHQLNIISWTSMIGSYADHEYREESIQVYQQMHLEGFNPNKITIINVLSACNDYVFLTKGIMVHAECIKIKLEMDVVLGTAFVNMYGKCDDLGLAFKVFSAMESRNIVSWNAIMVAHARCGYIKECIKLLQKMQEEGIKPNKDTYFSTITACGELSQLGQGKLVHAQVMNHFDVDDNSRTALMNMYGKSGDIDCACKVFNEIEEIHIVSCNSLISVCSQGGYKEQIMCLFQQMTRKGPKPNNITYITILATYANDTHLATGKKIHAHLLEGELSYDIVLENAFLHMYSKCGSFGDVHKVFNQMQERNIISWTTMIAAHVEHGYGKEAFGIYQQMQLAKESPNTIIYIVLLNGCASFSFLTEGKLIHAHAIWYGFESATVVGNALINMYGKTDNLDDASEIFNRMDEKDVISWNTIVATYSQYGFFKEAHFLFQQMQLHGFKPDEAMFISILNACSSRTVARLLHIQIDMNGFNGNLTLGTALVNTYGKCGSYDDARIVFDRLQYKSLVTWNAMIAVSAHHGYGGEALQLSCQMQLQGLSPNDITLVSILTACSHAGLVHEGWHYFVSMGESYSIPPRIEHFGCIIDLFGRLGWLDRAEEFIHKTPIKSSAVLWMSLLGACRSKGDVERGKRAAEYVIELDPLKGAPYIVLSNIYAAAGRWLEVVNVRKMMADRGIKRQTGRSSIEVNSIVHEFVVGDISHPATAEIYMKLESLDLQLKAAGYVPNTTFVLHDVEEESKLHLLSRHSEKLAIAFGMISTPLDSPLYIIKNLRVCDDCHSFAKLISRLARKNITLRDNKRFHHFKDGNCSCGDYW